ncbi:unnamed protein product, partial [Prorocentrum cordatum]
MSMCLLISASARVATQAVPFFDGASSRGQKACIKSYQPTRNHRDGPGSWSAHMAGFASVHCMRRSRAGCTCSSRAYLATAGSSAGKASGRGCIWIYPASFPVEVPTSGSQKQGGHPSRRPPTERPPRQALGRGPPGGRTVGPRWAVGRGAAGPALFQPRASLGWRSWRRRGRRTRRRRRRRR